MQGFDAMDWAVMRAGELGLRLIVPLTDQWNRYHGGSQDFLGWRGLSSLPGQACVEDAHSQVGQQAQSWDQQCGRISSTPTRW